MGVAALFSACKKNNYKILYLSSRSIGQTDVTRDYLFGLRQGKSCEVLPGNTVGVL
jgi:phosphatidate phosphatase LPIN